jgi:hypothetical protein
VTWSGCSQLIYNDKARNHDGIRKEYLVIAFSGNQFKSEIGPTLIELTERGTIRIIELLFVKKDTNDIIRMKTSIDRTPKLVPVSSIARVSYSLSGVK